VRVGLIGKGYWGSIIKKKLITPIELIFEADSQFNYEAYLDQIDWAFVATPAGTHFPIVKKLLEEGINVFCEKPFTGNAKDSAALFDIAKKNQQLLYVNNIFLYRNSYLQFKELLKAEKKNIQKVEFIWNKYGPFKDSIKNDLFYHDVYLFLDIIERFQQPINIQSVDVDQSVNHLIINAQINNIEVVFAYDRLYKGEKHKLIKVNDTLVCDFSKADNDPLNEMIQLLLFDSEKFNFEKCQSLTLQTESLIDFFDL